MKKVKWGVISTANIAQTQVIPAIFRSENAELVGISSRGEKAKAVAENLNIPVSYDSYEKMLLDPQIEAVYIPLPNHLHKEWALKAAQHGKHVLCEKPVALTVDEATEIVESCNENKVKFMEAFMYQFHPQHARVKEVIDSGEIGEVKFMRASFSFYLNDRENDIRMDKSMGGGSLYDVGCYCIHSIRNTLGVEPTEIWSNAILDPQTGIDLSVVTQMKMENGMQVMFDCSFDMTFRQEYEVVGTKGKITVPAAYRPDVSSEDGVVIVQSEDGQRRENITGDAYKAQVELFSRAILEDSEVPYSHQNTIQNMRVIDACYQSIEENRTVTL